MELDQNFFAGVKFKEVEAAGQQFRFPVLYRDFRRIAANFPAPAAKVQEVLPTPKLNPIQIQPGVTLIGLVGYEYRHIDGLAPYNEFGIGVPVQYETQEKAPKPLSSYVLHLPVTTEEARWGGVEFYGFPKFSADIRFEDAGDVCHCRLRAEDKDILTLEVPKLESTPQVWDFYAYTLKAGHLLKTHIQVQGLRGLTEAQGGASYRLGDHPIAEELRALELGKTSIGHEYCPKLQMILPLPAEQLPL